tara:strand:- start:596 stop:844 length:249 start_codon:yes stop_codon:yes gene_type:complete
LSDRATFLCEYASRLLGRDLTEEETKAVSEKTSRRDMQMLVESFKKPVAKATKAKKTKSVSVEEVVEEIVNEEQGKRGKGSA